MIKKSSGTRQITADSHQQALDELAMKTRALEYTFERAPYIMMFVDADGRVTDINRTGVRYTGRGKDELLGLLGGEVFGCLNSFDGQGCGKNIVCKACPVRSRVTHTIETGEPIYEGEGRLDVKKDGASLQLDILVSTALVPTAEDKQVLVTIADITERKRAEDALLDERRMFIGGPTVIFKWVAEAGWPVEYVSPNVLAQLGYSVDDFTSRKILFVDIIHPDDLGRVADEVRRYSESGISSFEQEYRIIRADGETRWLHDFTVVKVNDAGAITHFQGYVQDITERRQAEDALQESEEMLQSIFVSMPDSITVVDLNGTIKLCNQATADLHGYSTAEQLSGKNFIELTAEEDHQRAMESMLQVINNGVVKDIPFTGLKSSGEKFAGELSVSVIKDVSGSPSGFVGITKDVTERKQAEDALRESEERFRAIFEQAAVGVALLDTKTGNYARINQAYCDFLGYTSEEMVQKGFQNITYPDDVQANAEYNAQLISGQIQTYSLEKRYVRRDGTVVWGRLTASPLWKPGETPNTYFHIAVVEDITARKQAEEVLRESEARFSTIFHTNPARVAITRFEDGLFLDVNQAFLDSSGYAREDVIGHASREVDNWVSPADVARLRKLLEEQGAVQNFETQFHHKSGQIRDVLMSADLIEISGERCILTVGLDITERKRAEAELQNSLSELKALYENGLAISTLREPRVIGQKVIETLSSNLSWHHIAIRLLRSGTNELELIAFNQPGLGELEADEYKKRLSEVVRQTSQGLSGWSIEIGQAIRTGNVQKHPQYVNTYSGICSGMYMPLAVGERVIGCITVESEIENAFTEQDESFLATLARQTAIAFENARLYQNIQQELLERERAEAALRESDERFRALFENSIEGVALHEIVLNELGEPVDYIFLMANPGFETHTGLRVADILGKPVTQIYPGIEKSDLIKIYGKVALTGDPAFFETLLESTQQFFKVTAYQVGLGRFAAVFENITERKQAEEALRASLVEKETLLKEVHHRVKNNLASINGLINLQQDMLTDPAMIAEFGELSGRIHSMALVHELLYQSETLSRIDVNDYFETLVSHIRASYDPSARVHLSISASGVEMELDNAIPCGLMVNELVTNAFKYAFPDGKPHPGQNECTINVTADWDGNAYSLSVSDNGVGLPASFNWKTSNSLGLQLVMLLGQRQLKGQVELERTAGTVFKLRFTPKNQNER